MVGAAVAELGCNGQLLDEIACHGVPILLVAQQLTIALKTSHRLYVMGHGRMAFEGTPADLAANEAVRKERLEVSPARRAPCTPGSTHSVAPDARGRRLRPGVR